ncbi:hypothetical protein RFI_24288 [Reticulomyxa filosa]|uniref:FYVE-type domain-containing protein n=1 Tax=Reticulomyxa filosa TaxID=46433 RepID=X6MHD5_RETFI|nr:hypothetical protein RFI_24288 [Reticulomyxa filosa]|eukprot:ETO13086.1 hypothetical protein RFI_24288 [Reticulomyxa filosa]
MRNNFACTIWHCAIDEFFQNLCGKKLAWKTIRSRQQSIHTLYEKGWVPDKQAPQCMICRKKFNRIGTRRVEFEKVICITVNLVISSPTLFPLIVQVDSEMNAKKKKTKHHCRECGRVVCDKCSPHRKKFAAEPGKKRICRECFSSIGPVYMSKQQVVSEPDEAENEDRGRSQSEKVGMEQNKPKPGMHQYSMSTATEVLQRSTALPFNKMSDDASNHSYGATESLKQNAPVPSPAAVDDYSHVKSFTPHVDKQPLLDEQHLKHTSNQQSHCCTCHCTIL